MRLNDAGKVIEDMKAMDKLKQCKLCGRKDGGWNG